MTTHPSKDDQTLRVAGCSNHGCMVRWPPPPKGSAGTNATCRCVHNLVRDGKWLELLRALEVRNIEIQNLTVQLDAELKWRRENCDE